MDRSGGMTVANDPRPTWDELTDRLSGRLDALLAAGAAMQEDRRELDEVIALMDDIRGRARTYGFENPAALDAIDRVTAVAGEHGWVTHADYRESTLAELDQAGALLEDHGSVPMADLPEGLRRRLEQSVIDSAAEGADGNVDAERALVQAYVDGATGGQAGRLYIEGDVLILEGWWQVSLRLSPNAYLVRGEPPPSPTAAVTALHDALSAKALAPIDEEQPLIQAVTYAELSMVHVNWVLWALDSTSGVAALAARAMPDDAPTAWAPRVDDDPALGDLREEFAASLVEGMPQTVVLAIGLEDEQVAAIQGAAPLARVEAHPRGEGIAACGRIVPHVVVVNAADEGGERFLLEFRADACGRHVPVAAVTTGDTPRGADVVLDPADPSAWEADLLRILP